MIEHMTIRCPLCADLIDVPVELESLTFSEPAMRGDENWVRVRWREQSIAHEHLKQR